MTARLLRFDGRPSAGALLAIAGCVAIAFAAAFVTRVSRGAETPSTGPAVPESRLTGEVVSAADRAAAPRLRSAAALPALAPGEVRKAKRRKSRQVERKVSTPVSTPAPEAQATPEPAATATPVATSPPPVSPPASSSPVKQPSTPAPTPGQTFDSSG